MTRYFIESIKCDAKSMGPMPGVVVAEAYVRKEDGTHFYASLSEFDGMPNFFITDESTFDEQVDNTFDSDYADFLTAHSIEVGEYSELHDYEDEEWYDLYRYLVYIVRADWDDCNSFMKKTEGKWLDEIDIPMSDIEDEMLEDEEDDEDDDDDETFVVPTDSNDIFKLRLMYETSLSIDSVYRNLDSSVDRDMKKKLSILINACPPDANVYTAWKENYIQNEYERLKNKKFLKCNYMFAGIGGYEDVFPEEMWESFCCWIDGNGSAFRGEPEPATEKDVKQYIALHAGDHIVK